MKSLLFSLFAAVALVSCVGGGNEEQLVNAGIGTPNAAAIANPGAAADDPMRAKIQLPDPTLAAQPVSLVNTTTTGDQVLRSIGAVADGGYIVAWISTDTTLFIQRYDGDGNKVGTEVSVPLAIQSDDAARAATALREASVAVLEDGSVMVAYQIDRLVGQVGAYLQYNQGIYIQRFDASGTQLMGETEVFSRLALSNPRPVFLRSLKIEPLADGGFVLGWLSVAPALTTSPNAQLFTRRYDSQAQPVGDTATVGLFGIQNGAPGTGFAIVADASGGYTLLVSYNDANTGLVTVTSATHYDASGTGTQIVAPRTGPVMLLPLTGGGFVLFATDTGGTFNQMLDASGNPVGNPVSIASMPFATRELMDGTYVVFWNSGATITAQRYDSTGATVGDLLTLETGGSMPGVAALAEGGFAAAWSTPGAGGDLDVFTQRFIEVLTQSQVARRKACLASAKGLIGQERKVFMDSCLR
jgi:hypothetical protein